MYYVPQKVFACVGLLASISLLIPLLNIIPILIIIAWAPLSLIITVIFLISASIGSYLRLVRHKGNYTISGALAVIWAWFVFLWLLNNMSHVYRVISISNFNLIHYSTLLFILLVISLYLLICDAEST